MQPACAPTRISLIWRAKGRISLARKKDAKALELKRFKRTLLQVLILPIVACLVLAEVLVWQIAGSNSTVTQIERSDRRVALATRIEKYVVDEETGLRGYQVTSDPRFLLPYTSAHAPMQQAAEKKAEWKLFLELLWETGAAQ